MQLRLRLGCVAKLMHQNAALFAKDCKIRLLESDVSKPKANIYNQEMCMSALCLSLVTHKNKLRKKELCGK